MLIIHRMFRNKRDTALFCVLVDAENAVVLLTKWVAANDRIERLKTFTFTKEVEPKDKLCVGTDGMQMVDLAAAIARYMAEKPRIHTVEQAMAELKTDYPDVHPSELKDELKVRKIADRQQVARRVDIKAGDCIACGVPLKYHFDGDNRRMTCAWAVAKQQEEATKRLGTFHE